VFWVKDFFGRILRKLKQVEMDLPQSWAENHGMRGPPFVKPVRIPQRLGWYGMPNNLQQSCGSLGLNPLSNFTHTHSGTAVSVLRLQVGSVITPSVCIEVFFLHLPLSNIIP
jgi:hypothetical protein